MLVIAHRGASARTPENTVPAMRAALDAGAHGVEFDVRVSADGHAVLMHDDDVSRTTGGIGHVSAMTLAQLRELEARVPGGDGTRGEGATVPTLDEVLEVVAGRLRIVLEIKPIPDAAGGWSAEPVLAVVAERLRGVDDLMLTSFDPVGLVAAHRVLPGVPTALAGYRTGEEEWMLRVARDDGHLAVSIQAAQADEAFIRAAHEQGTEVWVWEAAAAGAPRFRDQGVDAMITADPAAALAALR